MTRTEKINEFIAAVIDRYYEDLRRCFAAVCPQRTYLPVKEEDGKFFITFIDNEKVETFQTHIADKLYNLSSNVLDYLQGKIKFTKLKGSEKDTVVALCLDEFKDKILDAYGL